MGMYVNTVATMRGRLQTKPEEEIVHGRAGLAGLFGGGEGVGSTSQKEKREPQAGQEFSPETHAKTNL